MLGVAHSPFRKRDADGGRNLVSGPANWDSEAVPLRNRLLAINGESLSPHPVKLAVQPIPVDDRVPGKAPHTVASQQFFTTLAGLESSDDLSKGTGIGRNNMANDIDHADDLGTLDHGDHLDPIVEQRSQAGGLMELAAQLLQARR